MKNLNTYINEDFDLEGDDFYIKVVRKIPSF